MMRRLLLALVFWFSLVHAWAASPVLTQVYMFGFAASFTDSVAYITDIQMVDSAYVFKKTGFLADRTLYASQLSSWLLTNLQRENMTCVVFFSPKRASLEKQFAKVKKKYQSGQAVVLTPLSSDAFQFTGEEWIESFEVQTSAEDPKKKQKMEGLPFDGSEKPDGPAPGGFGMGGPQ